MVRIVCLASVLLVLAPAFAGDTVTDRLVLSAPLRAGEKTHVVSESKTTRRLVVREGARSRTDEALDEKALDYVREIAAVDTSGRVLAERRVFARGHLKDERGQADESLEGRTVVLGPKKAVCEGKPPGPLALELLEQWKLAREPEDGVLAPAEKVSEGASWPLDFTKAFLAVDGSGIVALAELDPGASSARGRVVKLERKDGVLSGRLEIDLQGKAVSELPNLGPVERSGFSLKVVIEGCLDGTRPDRTVTIEGSFDVVSRLEATKSETTLVVRRTARFVRSAAR